MNYKNVLLGVFTSYFLFNCSGGDSDEIEIIPSIEINSIENSNEFAFIEDTITINLDASGQSNVEAISNNSNVTVSRINETTYSVNATETADANIEFTFSNEEFSETASVDLSFYEHAVINNSIVEGIEIDIDNSSKLSTLLGTPDYIQINESTNTERWHYFDLGLRYEIASNDIIDDVRLYAVNIDRDFGDVTGTSGIYQNEIGNSLRIANGQLTMDTVLETYGTEYEQGISSTVDNLFYFNYTEIDVVFFYFADNADDFSGKMVPYINVY